MEREIKFRAWHTEQKRMFKVWGIGPDFITEYTFDGVNPGVNAFCDDDLNFLKVMQYTGLKDKSGKEIYEGDIIPSLNGTGNSIVSFENGTFTWHGEPLGWDLFTKESPEEIKTETWAIIIGNIYENPELINP